MALSMKKEYKASTSMSKTCEDFGTSPATAMKSLTNFQVFVYYIKRATCVYLNDDCGRANFQQADEI